MYKYIYFTFHTLLHKTYVLFYLSVFAVRLIWRGVRHDNSKLVTSEFYWYGSNLPLFKSIRYGTKEYNVALSKFQHSIEHHYQLNSHHPEHYPGGYSDMTLLDLIEMYYDWKAASKKKIGTGSFEKSIDLNITRFKMSEDLSKIFKNSI